MLTLMRPSVKRRDADGVPERSSRAKRSRQKRGIKGKEVKKARSLSTPISADEGKADRPPSRATRPYGLDAVGFLQKERLTMNRTGTATARPFRLLLWAAAIGLAGWGAGQATAADDGLKEIMGDGLKGYIASRIAPSPGYGYWRELLLGRLAAGRDAVAILPDRPALDLDRSRQRRL